MRWKRSQQFSAEYTWYCNASFSQSVQLAEFSCCLLIFQILEHVYLSGVLEQVSQSIDRGPSHDSTSSWTSALDLAICPVLIAVVSLPQSALWIWWLLEKRIIVDDFVDFRRKKKKWKHGIAYPFFQVSEMEVGQCSLLALQWWWRCSLRWLCRWMAKLFRFTLYRTNAPCCASAIRLLSQIFVLDTCLEVWKTCFLLIWYGTKFHETSSTSWIQPWGKFLRILSVNSA